MLNAQIIRDEIEKGYPQGVDALLAYWTHTQVQKFMLNVSKTPDFTPSEFESVKQIALLYIYLRAEHEDIKNETTT